MLWKGVVSGGGEGGSTRWMTASLMILLELMFLFKAAVIKVITFCFQFYQTTGRLPELRGISFGPFFWLQRPFYLAKQHLSAARQ